MKNLEIKKNKGLKLNFTILILFSIHLFSILIAFKTKDFQVNKYPLARILDSYLAISLFFNPLALSSLVKKVIEIEEKFKNLLQDKLEKFKEFTWDMDTGTYSMEFNNITEYDFDEIVNLTSEKYKEITEAIIN